MILDMTNYLGSVLQAAYQEEPDQEQDKAVHTIFCSILKHPVWKPVRHMLILGLLAFTVYALTTLYRTRNEHPIKQKAPTIALLHLSLMLLYLSFLYFLELNSLQSWKNTQPGDIPILRRFSQYLVVNLRISFTSCFILRTVVLYFQWKCTHKSWWISKALANQKKAILICFFGNTSFNIISSIFIFEGGFAMFYPSIIWYCPTVVRTYKLMNTGFFSILEIIALTGCFLVLRHFPSNFGVKKEAIAMCVVCICCTSIVNFLNPFNMGVNANCNQSFPPYFTHQFFFEYIRLLSLVGTIFYFNRPLPMVPPPPTRMLDCFKVFMASPICVRAFTAFVQQRKCPILIKQFEEYMIEQIAKPPVSTDYLIARREYSTHTLPHELKEAFKVYRGTKSFQFVEKILREYESVFHLRYKMVLY